VQDSNTLNPAPHPTLLLVHTNQTGKGKMGVNLHMIDWQADVDASWLQVKADESTIKVNSA
jgi:hypothetical protein